MNKIFIIDGFWLARRKIPLSRYEIFNVIRKEKLCFMKRARIFIKASFETEPPRYKKIDGCIKFYQIALSLLCTPLDLLGFRYQPKIEHQKFQYHNSPLTLFWEILEIILIIESQQIVEAFSLETGKKLIDYPAALSSTLHQSQFVVARNKAKLMNGWLPSFYWKRFSETYRSARKWNLENWMKIFEHKKQVNKIFERKFLSHSPLGGVKASHKL